MFKVAAAAAVLGVNGKTFDTGASQSLVATSDARSSFADGSTQKYHAQSSQFLAELEKYAMIAKGKELPASIRAFIDLIKTNSEEIKTKLVESHALQKIDLDARFNAFGTCETAMNTQVASIDGDGADTEKSLAAAAKVALCNCRKAQVMADMDTQGCQGELQCRRKDVDQKHAAQTAFLHADSGTLVDHYTDTAGVALCTSASGDGWKDMTGASDDEKALAWFDSQKVVSKTHWDTKETRLQALIHAYEEARDTRNALKQGTGAYAGKGCETLAETMVTKSNECSTLQVDATLSQCGYYNSKNSACEAYAHCYATATTAWEEAKVRETRDSQDRKDAWVSSGKIACLVASFTDNAAGNIEITDNDCSAAVCDAACVQALDLSVSLARVPPAASPCTLPPSPCNGWEASCNAVETGSWGDHTPAYFVGTRAGANCHVAAVPMGLAAGQHTQPCQQCSGAGGSDKN